MAGFESIIVKALAKHNPASKEVRQEIYESARSALEKLIQKNTMMDLEAAAQQRTKLEFVIAEIEAQYIMHGPACIDVPNLKMRDPAILAANSLKQRKSLRSRTSAPAQAAVPTDAPTQQTAPEPNQPSPVQQAPVLDTSTIAAPVTPSPTPQENVQPDPIVQTPAPSPSPSIDPLQAAATENATVFPSQATVPPAAPSVEPAPPVAPIVSPEPATAPAQVQPQAKPVSRAAQPEPKPAKTYPRIKLVLWTTLLAGLGMLAYWVYSQDLLSPVAERDKSVPNPLKQLPVENFDPDGDQAAWLNVFTPGDARGLIPEGSSQADILEENGQSIARIVSRDGSSITIEVPVSYLKNVDGRRVLFEITARSSDSKVKEFAVSCDFNVYGNCGRTRFTATGQAEPYLFAVNFERVEYRNQPGFIFLDTSMQGSGRAIDLFSVRMQIQKPKSS